MLSETLGQVALLALLHRRERHLLPDAPPRARRDAAARVHLSPRDGVGEAQPARDDRRGDDRRPASRVFLVNVLRELPRPASSPATIRGARRRSSGRRARRRRAWNFHHIPVVTSRAPLWEMGDEMPVATGLATDRREVLVTTALDAVPDNRHEHPGESHWPLVMAHRRRRDVHRRGVHAVGVRRRLRASAMVAFAGWGWPRGTKPGAIRSTPGRLPSTEAAMNRRPKRVDRPARAPRRRASGRATSCGGARSASS